MKTVHQLVLVFFCCALSNLCMGQHKFSNCSAAFLSNKMLVNNYSPKGKCSVATTATGTLTVNTVNLTPTKSKAVQPIPFKIAIRDKATKTLTLYSKEDVKQVNVQNVLAKCRKGDHIVLLTLDTKYALPHNEILVR